MKNIKTIFLASISILAITCVQAQDVKRQIEKPAESTVPAPGSRPTLAPATTPNPDLSRSGKPQQQPELKESTEKPVVVNDKVEAFKPQQAPTQNLVTTPVIVTDKRESAVNRAPQMTTTANSSNIAPAPAPGLGKNTAPPQQQRN